MDRKEQRILRRAERAGLKLARKTGHIPTKEELLQMKVQIVPKGARWILFGTSVICAVSAWYFNTQDNTVAAPVLAVLSFALLVFSIFGIRRTLENLADHLLVDAVSELIGATLGSVFD